MKLRVQLPLAFGLGLGLLLLSGLFGMWGLHQSLGRFQNQVMATVSAQNTGTQVQRHFATAVQEWKNVLLRGKDPEQRKKYWEAHQQQMREVVQTLQALQTELPPGDNRETTGKLIGLMQDMEARYVQGFDAFSAAEFDSAAGDHAVKGVDREASKTLEALLATLDQMRKDESVQAQASAQRSSLYALLAMLLVMGVTVPVSIWFSRGITRRLAYAVEVTEQVAQGHLHTHIQVRGQDEVAQVLESLKRMQEGLIQVVSSVRQGASSVTSASGEITQGTGDLSTRTEHQASALEETAASMEELSSTVRQNAQHAQHANELAKQASSVALEGGEVMAQVVQRMQGIQDSSQRIADIIGVIDGIAFQTNILALNAAVEAARAGEQGRGFAVVASEVRSLAGRSAEAAKEIKHLIEDSVQRVEQGSALVGRAGTTMSEVVEAINRVTAIVREISTASAEQSTGVGQIGEAVANLDQSTQQNAALVEEMSAATLSLSAQAKELLLAVNTFRLAA